MIKIVFFLFTIFFNTISNIMAQKKYEVMSVYELINIIREHGGMAETFKQQLDFNDALVNHLINGWITVTPAGRGQQGILFYEDEAFQEMIKKQEFPVDGDGSIFELEKGRVIEIEKNVNYYISLLSEKLDIKLNVLADYQHIEDLSRKIVSYGVKKVEEELFLPLGIFIGEFIRIKIDGKWVLNKEPTMNPYYIPNIINKNNSSYLLWKRLDEHFSYYYQGSEFDLKKCVKSIEATH